MIRCGCGKTLRAPEGAAGKKIRCPECKAIHAVPAAEPAPIAAAEPVAAAEPEVPEGRLIRVIPEPGDPPTPRLRAREAPAAATPRPKTIRAAAPPEAEDEPKPKTKKSSRPAWKKKRQERDDGTSDQPPVPMWGWVFAGMCGIIPVFTLGGAIPMAIGFGGAGGCVAVARDEKKPLQLRIGICFGIVILCWAIVIAVVGLALFMNK